MAINDRQMFENKLLSIWSDFSNELTGNTINIQIHEDYDEWKRCFLKIMGFPARVSGGAFASVLNNRHTIHLYVSDTMLLEDRFSAFLHELAHIYLGHFSDAEGTLIEKEAEADGWVAVNFSEEIKTVRRFIHWRQYDCESESELAQPTVSAEEKNKVREEIGEWFVIEKEKKGRLMEWIVFCEHELWSNEFRTRSRAEI